MKVNNANRTAALDADGNILPRVAETLGRENEVSIAKIAWLSRKDMGKAYCSMVVYVTKSSEAKRLLDNQYFHLAGESAYTTMFAPREDPTQCFNCQEIGHKGFACKKPQACGSSATVRSDFRPIISINSAQFNSIPSRLQINQINY